MEANELSILKKITKHQCKMLDNGVIFLKDCAVVYITPSGHLVINNRLPEKPPYLSHSQFARVLGSNGVQNAELPYVIIHWNIYCKKLHPSMRKGWRFNFDVDYSSAPELYLGIPFIKYDISICQSIWMGFIRSYRNSALSKLDIEFNMVLEAADTEGVEEIGIIKKMLRDLPAESNIEQYDTIEKLVSFWPTLLLPAPDWVAPKPPGI
jgi:hypothetical protein